MMLWAAYIMLIAPVLSFLMNGLMNQKQKTNDTDKVLNRNHGRVSLTPCVRKALDRSDSRESSPSFPARSTLRFTTKLKIAATILLDDALSTIFSNGMSDFRCSWSLSAA
jgi:hypothetical protein